MKLPARNRVVLGLACALLSACATQEVTVSPTAFRLFSPALADNAMLEHKHSGNLKRVPSCPDGGNLSPPLQWVNVPEKARSLVLLMEDQAGRAGLGVTHLVVYGIPASITGFAEGELSAPPQERRFVPGKNTLGTQYLGPCPPRGNAPQHYVFTLIATDLEPGALPSGLTKDEVLKALQGGRALRASNVVFRYAY